MNAAEFHSAAGPFIGHWHEERERTGKPNAHIVHFDYLWGQAAFDGDVWEYRLLSPEEAITAHPVAVMRMTRPA